MKMEYWIINRDLLNPRNKCIANEYLETLKYRGYKECTIRTHKILLQTFLLDHAMDIKSIEKDDVEKWFKTRYPSQPSMYNKALGILRQFFMYCQDEGYINIIPVKSYWSKKIPITIPKLLTESDLALIRLHTANLPLKERTIVEFLFSSACQNGETCGLCIENIDFMECRAMIYDAGGRWRTISFSMYVSKLIQLNLKNHPLDETALFLSNTGKRITPSVINRILHRLGKIAGLNETLTASVLRNTAIVQKMQISEYLTHNTESVAPLTCVSI